MAGLTKHANLTTPRARRRLKAGRMPHWQDIVRGKAHLGWQRWPGEKSGRWVLRRYLKRNQYRVVELGVADDALPADGIRIWDYTQAVAAAQAQLALTPAKPTRYTVGVAMAGYLTPNLAALGRPTSDARSRSQVHILPALGDLAVADLTAERLRAWLATMASMPKQTRPTGNKPQWRPAAVGDEAQRARRATANRVLAMLKAALNFAFDEGRVSSNAAWGRRLKPFRAVAAARVRWLTAAEGSRLIAAATPDFAALVRAALESGCRYGELTRLVVEDFNQAAGTLTIRRSKPGKVRQCDIDAGGLRLVRQPLRWGSTFRSNVHAQWRPSMVQE
jgi:hypothetical protein